MKKCPFCAEEIQDEAIKCRYCGEFLEPQKNEKEEELFDVVLHDCGSQKIEVIKILRETLNIDLVEAKELTDRPSFIKKSVLLSDAEKIRQEMTAVGAKVEVVLSGSISQLSTNQNISTFQADQPQSTISNQKSNQFTILIWVSIISVIVIISVCVLSTRSNNQSSGKPGRIDAYSMCKKFVTDELKAPSTAEFTRFDEDDVLEMSNDQFRVKGVVDSENSFGAMIRTNFTCTVRYDGDDYWTLTELEFE